jgi:Type IV secretion system pilin
MKKIKLYILSLGFVFSFGLAGLAVVPVSALSPLEESCIGNKDALVCQENRSVGDIVGIILDILLFGIGVISVVMIIVSGIRYSVSMGDAGNITKAKNSLMYAVIGLVVALLAYPLVDWLIKALDK